MCGNRVEELETRVKELAASVDGLTDELVECKVRIRELEAIVGEDLEFNSDTVVPRGEVTEELEEAIEEGDTPKPEAAEGEDNPEESEADSDSDIIVA